MYAILVKNSDNSYDVLDKLFINEEVESRLDETWDSNLPVVGINANDHKTTATVGSNWNGTSFDGAVKPGFFEAGEEKNNEYNSYVFIRENKVIHRLGVMANTTQAEKYNAAFAAGAILVKVPSNQKVYPGETYGWNGTEFTNP
jgi:hypothetical protein